MYLYFESLIVQIAGLIRPRVSLYLNSFVMYILSMFSQTMYDVYPKSKLLISPQELHIDRLCTCMFRNLYFSHLSLIATIIDSYLGIGDTATLLLSGKIPTDTDIYGYIRIWNRCRYTYKNSNFSWI